MIIQLVWRKWWFAFWRSTVQRTNRTAIRQAYPEIKNHIAGHLHRAEKPIRDLILNGSTLVSTEKNLSSFIISQRKDFHYNSDFRIYSCRWVRWHFDFYCQCNDDVVTGIGFSVVLLNVFGAGKDFDTFVVVFPTSFEGYLQKELSRKPCTNRI